MLTLLNLTPHAVTLHGHAGSITLQPDGPAPRLTVSRELVGEIDLGDVVLPVYRPTLGATEGLPEKQDGVFLIVSALVAEANKDRNDLVSPGELVRDVDGVIVGARGLCTYAA